MLVLWLFSFFLLLRFSLALLFPFPAPTKYFSDLCIGQGPSLCVSGVVVVVVVVLLLFGGRTSFQPSFYLNKIWLPVF